MNKTEKGEVISRLTQRLHESPNFYLTDFTGISVKRLTELRRRFVVQGVECMVVKNTLALRAFREASVDGLDDMLAGPTAFVFAGSDPISAAKVLAEFQREEENKPAVKAGLVDGQPITAEDIKRLAALPSRDELMGQVAGALQAPLQAFVGAMGGLLYQFVGVMESLRAQRGDAS